MGIFKADTHPSLLSVKMSMSKVSQIRQNYAEECEALVNKQAHMKLCHSYLYMSMWTYFNRDDVALPGFAEFFKKAWENEWCLATTLMKYQTKRGGLVVLQDVPKPSTIEWGTPLEVMTTVLDFEKKGTQELLNLHTTAVTKCDFHLVNFLQEKLLKKQINDIKLIGDLITKIKTVGDGLGIHMVDKDIVEMKKSFIYPVDHNIIGKVKTVEEIFPQMELA